MSKPTAHEVREFAHANGLPVSKRGRVGHDVVVAFLRANPALTRALALEAGIAVGTRGRMAPEVFEAVAGSL